MLDSRHVPDTWFIVAEQDFRFYQAHDVGDWLTKLAEVPAGRPGNRPPAEPVACASSVGGPAESSAGPAGGGWYPWEAPKNRHADDEASESCATPHRQEIKDLVIIATQARRRKHGNLVWYSWVHGGRGRKAHVGHGSSLLGLDRLAAKELWFELEALDSDPSKWPYHFDIWLLGVLQRWETKHREAASQSPGQRALCGHPSMDGMTLPRPSYVFPSVGGYASHISGCDPKSVGGDGTRGMNWGSYEVQEGVRPQDSRHPLVTAKQYTEERQLLKFVEKTAGGEKQPVEGGVLCFPEPVARTHDWMYFTERPPTRWDAPCALLRSLLERLGWVHPSGQWRGPLPESDLYREQNWREHQAWCSRRAMHPSLLEKIQTDPNGVDDDVLGSPNQLANFMKLIVVDWPLEDPASRWGDMASRERGHRRRALAFYRSRTFRPPGGLVRGP